MHNEAWTPEIDALITRLRRDERLSAKVIAARVSRTPGAVSARLLKLGVTIHGRVEWTDEAVARLRDLLACPEKTVRGIAREMGRTECSVRWKIEDLGLKPGRLRPWTKADDARALAAAGLSEAARRAAAAELGRSYEAFQARLVALGFRQKETWDAAAVARLKALVAGGATLEAVADDLGREPGAVRSKAYALGLRFPVSGAAKLPWTEEADRRLLALAAEAGTGGDGLARIAAALGRTERAVKLRLKGFGVVAGQRRRRPLDEAAKEEICAAVRSGMPLKLAIRELGRDARTLKAVAAAAGLAFVRAERPKRAKPVVKGAARPGLPARPAERRPVSAASLGAARAAPVRLAPARLAPARPGVRTPLPAARAVQETRVALRQERAGMEDAIARFIREKGVTRAALDPVEEAVRLVRARGYTVTGAGRGFVIDGRHSLADAEALFAFARARGIAVPERVAAAT